ncbi:MAG: hypothetical protein SF172_14115 [Burkholderiales bacterium]|nr:hypothetical protein [Burkholderiales bacterium]
MNPEPINIDKQAIAENIERSVDKAALRKVRNMVDNFERNERAETARQFWVMLAAVIVALVVFVSVAPFIKKAKAPAKNDVGDLIAACAARQQHDVRGERERELRQASPALNDAAIAARLKADAGDIYHVARRQCEQTHGRSK